jgi:acyl-CoA reductase-like NAD-dependent aldehyde dehydrogenase
MKSYDQFYIDGKWVDPISPNPLDVINPATEEVAATINLGSQADAEKAILAARRAFESFSQTSREERVELLEAIVGTFQKRIDEMADAITQEMGAPYEMLAKVAQAPAALGHLMTAAELLKTLPLEEDIGSTRIRREPIGVAGMITPWNWPANQIACKVAPALAAGCTMVLKPSEMAPLSGHVFADILHEAGVPAGVFNLVDGDGPTVGALLSSHPEIDIVSFTGSTRAGVLVSKAAADTVKKVALELGGKSANILLDDADFNEAVVHGVRTIMTNTGQSCNAPSRMLVPASRLEEVEAIAAATAAQVKVGDPRDPATTMGPLASGPHFQKVQEMIKQGIEEGEHLLCGGPGLPEGLEKGFFTRPTIFSRMDNRATLAQEEIFGPVLCIIPYQDEEDAIRIANDSIYGLSGYVYSGDLNHARAVAARLRTGNVHLNGAPPDFAASFGGYKQSGLGREWGKHGIEEYLEIKSEFGYNAAKPEPGYV